MNREISSSNIDGSSPIDVSSSRGGLNNFVANLNTLYKSDGYGSSNQGMSAEAKSLPEVTFVNDTKDKQESSEKETASRTAVKEVHDKLSKPLSPGFDKHNQADDVAKAIQNALKAGVPLDELIKALNKDLAKDAKLSPKGQDVFKEPNKAEDGKHYVTVTPGGVGGFALNATQSEKGEWTVKYDGERLRSEP